MVNREECKRQLEAGFGSPELAAILRPIAMDPERLQRFVELWNRNDVRSLGDIITTQWVTQTERDLVLPQTTPVPLTFSDEQVLEIVRMTFSAVDDQGAAINPDLVFADLQVGSRTHPTSTPVPVSQIAGNGINSWWLPVPFRLGIQENLNVSFTFDPSLNGTTIRTLSYTLHCIRLTF